MSEHYKPQRGDRVRVVIEGEVQAKGIIGFGIGERNYLFPDDEEVVSIEKIEPPAEVFKPGDVVRFRGTGDLYTLADEGYINHELAMFYGYQGEDAYRSDLAGKRRDDFTSKDYEKVSLG